MNLAVNARDAMPERRASSRIRPRNAEIVDRGVAAEPRCRRARTWC